MGEFGWMGMACVCGNLHWGIGVECGVGNYLFLEERFFFSEFLILFLFSKIGSSAWETESFPHAHKKNRMVLK
jgi:hypothetical protein